MNKTCHVGRLVAEPMLKKVGEKQTSCLRYTIAVQRPGKDAGADYIPCLTWGFEADYLANYAHKGTLISITGCNAMKKYKSILKENGVFVGVGNVNQAMKAFIASFTSRNFTYYAGAFTKQKDYLQYAKQIAEAGKLHTYIDKVYSVNETTKALQYLLSTHASGKVVIKIDF